MKESKLEQARDQLKQLQMQGKPESDLDHQMALTAAHKKLNSAQYEVDRAQMVVGQAEEKGYQKEQNAMAMQQVASRSMAALNSVAEQPGGVTLRSAAMQQSEKLLNNGAVLSLVLAKFIQSVGDNLVTKLEGDLEISNAMQEANKNDMLKKADEYEEQQRKAEEANKMTSCLGNIIGGIATAVGAIGMVFGGAGAGLMAVGIGLMVLDPIVEAVAGKSLTGMVLNPVIEHVFMPLMNVMSEILDKLIEYTPLGLLLEGLDKLTGLDITDTVKALASAAAAVAVFIAVAYVAKSAAKTVLDKMPKIVTEAVSQALKDTLQHVSNAVPNMVKNGSKKVGQTVSQLHKAVFKNDPLSQEKWINRMQLAHNTTMATGVVTQATGGVITGQLQKAAMDTLGGLTITSAQLEILKQLSEMVIESFEQKQQLIQQMWGEMHQQLVHRSDTGRAIMHNLRSSV